MSIMELKPAIKKLEQSKEFKKWKKGNADCFFSYAFIIVGEDEADWQMGYYNKRDDKVTTFIVGKKIDVHPEEEVFKEAEAEVKEVKKSKIKLSLKEVLGIAEKLQKKKYPKEEPTKRIVILQTLDMGQVWNITYVTNVLNTLNIKIDSETGEVKKDGVFSLFDFKAG